jgi:predicted  nucleic acid-binding Zn-ribbon protein
MAVLTFDTYEFIRTLKDSGFAESQAKGIADSIRQVDLNHVATKEDIREVREELRKDIQGVREELKKDIQEVKGDIGRLETRIESIKSDIFKWVVPMMLGQAGLIAALVKLL